MDYRNGLLNGLPIWTTKMDYPKLPTFKKKKISKAWLFIDRFPQGTAEKTADWLLISRVILLSADLSVMAQQSLKNCEFFTSVTQQIQQEIQK